MKHLMTILIMLLMVGIWSNPAKAEMPSLSCIAAETSRGIQESLGFEIVYIETEELGKVCLLEESSKIWGATMWHHPLQGSLVSHLLDVVYLSSKLDDAPLAFYTPELMVRIIGDANMRDGQELYVWHDKLNRGVLFGIVEDPDVLFRPGSEVKNTYAFFYPISIEMKDVLKGVSVSDESEMSYGVYNFDINWANKALIGDMLIVEKYRNQLESAKPFKGFEKNYHQ